MLGADRSGGGQRLRATVRSGDQFTVGQQAAHATLDVIDRHGKAKIECRFRQVEAVERGFTFRQLTNR